MELWIIVLDEMCLSNQRCDKVDDLAREPNEIILFFYLFSSALTVATDLILTRCITYM